MALIDPNKIPKHVAVIMDGNGRWAKKRGINRFLGHILDESKMVDTVEEELYRTRIAHGFL